uniref:Remorin REMO1-b n=1 Tax=Saccharum spontaneum TaxID=62335 RepID=A0A2R4SDR1_SACSP|nr:remorin REMO1-b [Saccharum spontaneum]AVZ46886.1 remorin REMO1-f [Saccharum spontaneum]AVZ46887.1 remorin REMO1-g [Saccharum spontaneum]
MAAEEAKKVEVEATKDIAEEKAVVPLPSPPTATAKLADDDSKAIVAVVKDAAEKPAAIGGSTERDAYLAKIVSEKRLTLITAWEESEKARAENRAAKKLAFITSWENAKKAEMEAELKKIEEQLEKKKAAYEEKLKNKLAMLHKTAEERRAQTEAKRGEEIILAEEMAAKYRAKGEAPTKLFGLLKA